MFYMVDVSEREGGSKAEVGVPPSGQTSEGHHAGVPRRLRDEHHGKEAGHVRAQQPGPKGKDAPDRLPQAGRQGNFTLFEHTSLTLTSGSTCMPNAFDCHLG